METNFIDDIFPSIVFRINDDHRVLTFHCDRKELVNLCGGIPHPGITDTKVYAQSESASAIRVTISTNLYTVTRVIDFSLRRIYNALMKVYRPGNGIGKQLFINQMKAAMDKNFTAITAYAQGPTGGDEEWEGYVFWAKIGFMMTHLSEIEEYEEMMHYYPEPDLTLGELVLTDAGCDFWRRDGFGWSGKFYLWEDSISMIQLKKYLESRGLLWMLD